MTDHNLNAFADRMVDLGRANGYILGLKRANEILRAHGIDVAHPARTQVYNEMLDCDQASVKAYSEGAVSAVPPPPAAA